MRERMLKSKSSSYEKLRKSASSTANFRFNAARRLDFLDRFSNLALIMASSALIITSIAIELLKSKVLIADYISIGQLCIPVLLLALSILVTNCKYGVRAEKMHDCAQKLNHYSKLFEYKVSEKNETTQYTPEEYIEYKGFCEEYARVLNDYDNHCDIDRTSQKIKDILGKGAITSPFKDLIAFVFNISFVGYFYFLINIASIYWVWHVLSGLLGVLC